MCNIKDHPFFQEYNLHETDIISLKSLYKSGIDIHMPVNKGISKGIELEVSFKNNESESLSLFKNILTGKYLSTSIGDLAERFEFKNEPTYFTFMRELSEILLLGFYAQSHNIIDGRNSADPGGQEVPITPMLGPKTVGATEKPSIDSNSHKIIGVSVKYVRLQIPDKPTTAKCYKAFMDYCIDNFSDSILNSDILRERFKEDPEDPAFGRGIFHKRIKGHNGLYYSTYQASDDQERIMKEVARELGFPVEFFYE